MLWLIGLLVVAVVVYLVYRQVSKGADAAFDHLPVVEEVKKEVVETLDVNKDGKVNLEDVKVAAESVKKSAKKAAGKAKKAVSKVKKPKLTVAK